MVAESLDRPYPWAVGVFFGNTELSLEFWTVIAGIPEFDEWSDLAYSSSIIF